MLPRGIGMLGGSRVVAASVVVQTAPTVPDLPDHPAERLVRQLREAGDKQTSQLPLTVGSLCCTVPILSLMARQLRRQVLPVLLPGVLAAGVLIAVDQLFGSAAFGTAAVIPAVVANAGQSIELVRAPRITGVSVLFLILAVVNQGLWPSWAILVPDIGTMIVASATGLITVFNLVWWSLRNLGLQPLRVAGAARPAQCFAAQCATGRVSAD